MDSFEKPHWSKLQVELWVCTRSREAVRLAEHAPGRTHFADLSIGPDGLDDEAYDQQAPAFDDEIELIGTVIINYGLVCEFDDARKELIVALSNRKLLQHQDRSSGVEFFEREEVLRLWPDPRWGTLRARVLSEPLDAADSARAPARNQARDCQKARIPPAPKRGPTSRFVWPQFRDALDRLIEKEPSVSHAEAVRAMSDWCAMAWGGEDGPGEPANSTVRKQIAAHPGAPWAKTSGKARRKPLSRRAKTSARTSV